MPKTYRFNPAALTTYREGHLYSFKRLEDLSGISKGQINRIENGKTKSPNTKTIYALADALKIDPYTLLEPIYVRADGTVMPGAWPTDIKERPQRTKKNEKSYAENFGVAS